MKSLSSVSLFFILVCSFYLTACSDPKSYEIGKLTEEQKKEIGQKLTADEGQKISAWMLRNAFNDKPIANGVTVGNAIKEQEEWIAKQNAEEAKAAELQKKVEAERKLKQEEFRKLTTVALVGKQNDEGDYGQKFITLHVAYENKGDKDIQGIKGILKINDLFGDKILNLRWTFDDGVDAKKTVTERGSGLEVNQFMDDHMKLWNTDFDKLKSSFEISTIIFKDGTKIEAPE